jgi:carbamoyl-phosphate synthase small subunit
VSADVALARVRAFPGLEGRDLVREVAPAQHGREFRGGPVFVAAGAGSEDTAGDAALESAHPATAALSLADEFPFRGLARNGTAAGAGKRIALIDCGMKDGIDQALRRRGAAVRIVTPAATPEELLAGGPHGVLVSNGPGDPDALGTLIATLRRVVGKVPLAGICLGHQVLALALGARTYKMKFGHHGINHPVRDLETGAVLVTSQNHGFAVDPESLRVRVGGDVSGAAVPTHESLNDGVLEGFAVPELAVRAVQFHPEAQAGPHDARVLFTAFLGAAEPR